MRREYDGEGIERNMAEFIEKIKQGIMLISFQERRKRELEHYRQEKSLLQYMEKDEIDLEYINLKSEYEHKKNVLFVFMTSIVISMLMSAWDIFGGFVGKILEYVKLNQGSDVDIADVTFIICTTLLIFITAVLLLVLILYVRRIGQLYKKILMIEEIKKVYN